MAMPERIWAEPFHLGGLRRQHREGYTEYVLASTHQRALEALREAEKALERFNRGGITLFGNEEDVPITFKGKDFKALRAALTRIKGDGK